MRSKFVIFSFKSSRNTNSTSRLIGFFSSIFLLVKTCRTLASFTQCRMSASVVVKFKFTAVRPARVTAKFAIADAAVAGSRIPTKGSFTPRTSRTRTRRIASTVVSSFPPVNSIPLESASRMVRNVFLHDRMNRRAGVSSCDLPVSTATVPNC